LTERNQPGVLHFNGFIHHRCHRLLIVYIAWLLLPLG
jgi:hypothetical protein